MTLQEVEMQLPNGLHDAVLRKYIVDYEAESVTFSFDVWVGDLRSDEEDVRERYKPGTLVLKGLRYLAVEPPSQEVAVVSGPYTLDVGNVSDINTLIAKKLPAVPAGSFDAYFFLYVIEAFIYVCATEAIFNYDD